MFFIVLRRFGPERILRLKTCRVDSKSFWSYEMYQDQLGDELIYIGF
jgi:hypothetical protein